MQGWGRYPARGAAKSAPGRGSEPARAGEQDVVPSGKQGWLGACVQLPDSWKEWVSVPAF